MITSRIHISIFQFPIILLINIILFSSCFKDEDTKMFLPPRQPGDPNLYMIQNSIDTFQTYIILDTIFQEVAFNNLDVWDLGFEASSEGWHVILNSAANMSVVRLEADFENITTHAGIDFDLWKQDDSGGDLDLTAFGEWIDFTNNPPIVTNNIFIINRGYDAKVNHRGYRKLKFISYDENSYTFLYANMDGSNENTITIEKDESVNFVSFSFKNNGEELILEPNKDSWHLLFTGYSGITYTLAGEPTPYFVRGPLLNRNGIQSITIDSSFVYPENVDTSRLSACMDTSNFFSCFDRELAQQLEYSSKLDTIGHSWKHPGNVDNIYYTTDTNMTFIIKTINEEYYKLRFIDYYNSFGLKGYPSLEYQKLE